MVNPNIRGIGGSEKQRELTKLLAREFPDIMAIQETMLQQDLDDFIKCLWKHSELGYAQKFSSGRSGGMLFLWNRDVWSIEQIITSEHFLGLIGNWRGKDNKYLLFNVYAPQLTSQKRSLWIELRSLITKAPCVSWVTSTWLEDPMREMGVDSSR